VFSTFNGEQDVITDDPADPSRRLIRQVLGAVGEYERSLIRLRLAGGQRRKAAAGGYAAGRPRYGYRAAGGALVPDPAEQDTLRRMRELRAAGQSYREITATLAEDGRTQRNGRPWLPNTVQRILSRAA